MIQEHYSTTIILFGSQHVHDYSTIKNKCKYLIVYNLEQLHFTKWHDMIRQWNQEGVHEIWDYSLTNMEYIRVNYPTLLSKYRKVLLGYSPYFQISDSLGLDRRLAFIGNMSQHRITVLSKIIVPYKVYSHHYFENYRQVLNQHNIFLNIHFQIPAILEIARILPLVCNRKIVYSECSMDSELDNMFDGLVEFYNDCSYEQMKDMTEDDILIWRQNTETCFNEFQIKTSMKTTLESLFLDHVEWVSHTTRRMCVATLHCNNRKTIFKTIKTFLEETICPDQLDWIILSQGCTDEHNQQLEEAFQSTSIKPIIIPLLVNMGWSKGMNELYRLISERNYTYVLHLEDDWICDTSFGSKSAGKNVQWLGDCLCFLDNHPDVSTLFLRQYRSDMEKMHYGWSRSFRYQCFRQPNEPFNYAEKIKSTSIIPFRSLEFREIPHFMYTANPTIFRLDDYIQRGIFPFPVYQDASQNQEYWSTTSITDAPEWGQAEALSMEKLLGSKCMNVNRGFFYHHF
jgi:hypothetical protein